MSTLGVVVFSLRGMKQLAQCLASVQWADAVMVLHLGEGEPSIGDSPSLSPMVRKVSPGEDVGHFYEEIRTDWVLHLWGEERVEAKLGEELKSLCRAELKNAPLEYRIPIRSQILGSWVNGSLWGPTPSFRLSRKVEELSLGWWNRTEREIEEPPGVLRGWIGDYASVQLSDGFDRVQSVSQICSKRLEIKNRTLSTAAMAVFPLRVFMRLLLMNGVFHHGLAGLTLSTLAAYATLLSGAKMWEARNVKEEIKGGGKVQ